MAVGMADSCIASAHGCRLVAVGHPIRLRTTSLQRSMRWRQVRCHSRRRGSQKEQSPDESTPEVATSEADIPSSTSDDLEKLSVDGKRMGWSFFPEDKEQDAKVAEEAPNEDVPFVDLTNPGYASEESLPTVSREQVLSSCLSVSSGIFIMSFLLRSYAERGAELLGNDPDVVHSLLSLTPQWKLDHVAIAFVAAAIVSGARLFLYSNWKDFAVSTNRSNKQVLLPLNFGDILFVSFIPGISEEMLFRGGLIPALFADWRGVLISGVIFGILHKGGGRNNAFVIWASAVGCLYGYAFLLTQDIYVPIVAHSSANLFSALNWLSKQEDSKSQS